MSVRKNASIATIAVLFSRLAGLIREMVFAFFFGAGPALDAFIAAFRIPNLLRDLFSEGALSTAFVTVFSQKAAKEGDESAWKLANAVLTFILIVVGSLTVLGIIFSPWIVSAIASGFSGNKFDFTVHLNRILFPFILFVSFAAVCMGMLNTKGKFALPQSASTFFNVTSIVSGLAFAWWLSPDLMTVTFKYLGTGIPRAAATWENVTRAMTGMALGTLLGGLVQWLVQMPELFKLGFRLKPWINWKDEGLLRVLKLTGPAIIGGAAVQVNVLVNTNFASYLVDGSISWLNYAFRLMQFPIGLFGVAVATATTPVLARLASQNNQAELKKTLTESTQMALFLCIPSALGLIIFARPIMALIYQHGHFTAADTVQAAYALQAYAVGLSFYALIKIYQPAFLAFNDARTPMIISLLSIATNFALNWVFVFVFHFTHWGLALGTSFVAITNASLLLMGSSKYIPGLWRKDLGVHIIKILGAGGASVAAGWAVAYGLAPWGVSSRLGSSVLSLFIPMGVVVGLYIFISGFLGVEEAHLLKKWFQKRLPQK